MSPIFTTPDPLKKIWFNVQKVDVNFDEVVVRRDDLRKSALIIDCASISFLNMGHVDASELLEQLAEELRKLSRR